MKGKRMLETGESITAKICAFARANHSYFNRDKVYDDYLAFDLLGNEEYEYLKNLTIQKLADKYINKEKLDAWYTFLEYITPIPLSRIAYTEDKLYEFAKENDSCQYVICGAGYDSFAFRNENPDIEIFELDHPNTQKRKMQRIREMEWIVPENVHFESINFEYQSIDKTLINAKFDPNKKTFYSMLGVSYYLTLETLKDTFYRISKISASGSRIVFDFPDDTGWKNDSTERIKTLKSITEELGEKMTDGFSYVALQQVLKEYKYQMVDHQSPDQIQDTYFRNRKDNLRAFEHVHFITAEFE